MMTPHSFNAISDSIAFTGQYEMIGKSQGSIYVDRYVNGVDITNNVTNQVLFRQNFTFFLRTIRIVTEREAKKPLKHFYILKNNPKSAQTEI